MSEKELQILTRRDLLPNIKGKSLEPCIGCLAGKQHMVTFYKNIKPPRREHILDLIHSDMHSMIEKSLGGALHLLLLLMSTQARFGSLC